MSTLKFLSQTRDAISSLPLLYKILALGWSLIPVILVGQQLKYSPLFMVAYAVMFSLIWALITFATALIAAFQRQNKKTLNTYMLEKNGRAISSQTWAQVMQSKKAYEDFIKTLPPSLAHDRGLYVGAKLGRISKLLFILMLIAVVGATIMAG